MNIIAPSYQIPGTWLENARALAPQHWLAGLELLFFSYDDDARKIFEVESEQLAELASRYSFSLHLPDPMTPDTQELVERTRKFVELYVFHPEPDHKGWNTSMRILMDRFGAENFAMEYTGEQNFEAGLRALAGADLRLCADTGVLLREGHDPAVWIADRVAAIAEIHLHGVQNGKDHHALSDADTWLRALIPYFSRAIRINLETFSLDATRTSYATLQRILHEQEN
mgnify:CR=1 FL=1